MSIAENLEIVRRRLEGAAERSGRDAGAVKLIGVVKGMPVSAIREAYAAGLRDIAENFVQEGREHSDGLGESSRDLTWHLIGHLQSNKIAMALNQFDMIHSVDSVRLAEQISRRASTDQRVLLEVNVAAEASKFGFAPSEVGDAVSQISRLSHIELAGLMTVAPAVDNAETVRPVFRTLRELADANGLAELSMGMTGDFEVAIEEGATLVRIGRAIFGERSE
jgi:pyridoxal phosphate enzyme (YggS family)